jgi:small subunit ribosomal protein S20
MLAFATRKLDKAASKGVIHKNQAANKKSALTIAFNKITSA